jgi:hypothetical protein
MAKKDIHVIFTDIVNLFLNMYKTRVSFTSKLLTGIFLQ